jgi:hypothetical protein
MADQLDRAEDVRTRADRLLRRERWRVDGVTFTRQDGSVKLIGSVDAEVIGAVDVNGRFEGPVINGKLVGPDGTLTTYQRKGSVAQDRSSAGAGRGSVSEGHGAKQVEPDERGASWVVPAAPPVAGRDRTGGKAVDDPALAAEKGLGVWPEAGSGGLAPGSTQQASSPAAKQIKQRRTGKDGQHY